mmetsp:Transcript_18644/g.16507  ORF Transcript_18644/g.16507 Transcript_18644/m.16507 type:complete len:150 (+) Transcript_18644:393-842(+)
MSENKLDAWDKHLAHKVYPMTFAYFNRFLFSCYIDWLSNFNEDAKTKAVFTNIGLIFAQSKIIEDGEFYRDFLSREQLGQLKEDLMDNLLLFRKEAVAMTYLLPFTDKMYGAIARSEMKPYEYFLDAVSYAERTKDKSYDDDIIVSSSS